MSRPSNAVSCTLPHPDHFDPKKFDAEGRRIGGLRGKVGKRSRLKPEDVEQLLFLQSLRDAAQQDVVDFLVAKGFKTERSQEALLSRLRNGWRPTR